MPVEFDRIKSALGDRYDLQGVLGKGGMATVYLARDLKHDRNVAIKVLDPDLAMVIGPHRFLREIEIVAKLSHPHILPLHDSGVSDGFLYYVMPRIPDGSVQDLIEQGGPMATDTVIRVLQEMADALDHAHRRGMVHRDIKPGNVLRSGRHFLLADFGIAKGFPGGAETANLTLAGAVGTPGYMAPEQIVSDPRVDHRTDIYALGVLAYEMLAGGPPFAHDDVDVVIQSQFDRQPPSIAARRKGIPRRLTRIIDKCLATNPDDRFQTAAELLAALEGVNQSGRRSGLFAGATLGMGGLAVVLSLIGGRPSDLVPQRVVVAEFNNQTGNPSLDELGSFAAHWITVGLQRTEAVDVVPTPTAQHSLRNVRAELEAGNTIDPIRSLADETRAGTVIAGSIYDEGGKLRFQVEVSDAERGALIDGFTTVALDGEDASSVIDRVRERTTGALAILFDERLVTTGRSVPPTFEAYRAFKEGLDAYTMTAYRRAIPHFGRAATIDSSFVIPLLFEALSHLNLGQWAEADSLVSRLDARRDHLSEYHGHWLTYLEARIVGNNDASLQAMRKASMLAPTSKATYNRALMALRAQRPVEAYEALEMLDPDRGAMRGWLPYWNQRTWALHELGRLDDELRAAREARRRHPERLRALQLETDALASMGMFDALDSVLLEAERFPPEGVRNSGFLMLSAGREAVAHGFETFGEELFARAIQWYEDNGFASGSLGQRHRYGIALYNAGRFESVEQLYRQFLEESPNHVGAHLYLGLVAARRGDRGTADEMVMWLESQEAPYQFGVRDWNSARIALLQGDREEALVLLRRSLEAGRGVRRFRPHGNVDFAEVRDDNEFQTLFAPRG